MTKPGAKAFALGAALLLLASAGGCGKSKSSSASSTSSGAPYDRDCKEMECVRAVECLPTTCAGEPIFTGCCPCPANYIDVLECAKRATAISDASADAKTK